MSDSLDSLRAHLKHKLALRVTLGSLAFTLVAGAAMFWVEFQRQHTEAGKLQDQLAATVTSSTAVAAYVKNEEITRDVISGLMSNPMVAAAGIETDTGSSVFQSRRVDQAEALKHAASSYPLPSPVNAVEIAGRLVIEKDLDYLHARAMGAARWPAAVMALQIGI